MPDLAPVLNKLMQLKRVADEHSHEIFSDCKREPGDGAPSRWVSFAAKNSDFNAVLITFCS